MAHYAILDSDNKVTQVIVGKDEHEPLVDGYSSWEHYYDGLRTSYNTLGGLHTNGGTPFRKNMAGIGYTYDFERDAFIPPKCHDAAQLNETTCLWHCEDVSHDEPN